MNEEKSKEICLLVSNVLTAERQVEKWWQENIQPLIIQNRGNRKELEKIRNWVTYLKIDDLGPLTVKRALLNDAIRQCPTELPCKTCSRSVDVCREIGECDPLEP